MKLIRLAIIAGLLITFALTIAIYPTIPDKVVSHWNAAGQADGYMSKFWGLWPDSPYHDWLCRAVRRSSPH